MTTGAETPTAGPASAPANSLEGRIQEVLGNGTVTAERLRELRDMLNAPQAILKEKDRRELLARIEARKSALTDAVGANSRSPEQKELGSELSALADRLARLKGPGMIDRAAAGVKGAKDWAVDTSLATAAGVPSIWTNYVEGGREAMNRNTFEGVMSFALPVLSILGFGWLAKKALKDTKSMKARILFALLGVGGVIAIANYSGRKAQAETVNRQARLPVEGRVKEIIDAARAGNKVDISDSRFTDVDLLQLRGTPIMVSGHEVRLEKVSNGSSPVVRVAVDGNAFELGVLASTMVQSITRVRGMADIAVLLGVSTGHAFVTDGEFTRIVSQLAGSTADTTVDINYFTDPAKPEPKQQKSVTFNYVQPAAAAPSA